MRQRVLLFAIPFAALLLFVWAGIVVMLGEPNGWALLLPHTTLGLFYDHWDLGSLAAWIGVLVAWVGASGMVLVRRGWSDALGLATMVVSLHWWLFVLVLEGATSLSLVMMVLVTVVVPWFRPENRWTTATNGLLLVLILWKVWGVLYAPLEPFLGTGPTGPRPWTIIVFGAWVALLFGVYAAVVLHLGRRFRWPSRGVHITVIGVVVLWLVVVGTSSGLQGVHAWGWMIPGLFWAGTTSWLVVHEDAGVRWPVWSVAMAMVCWSIVAAIIGLVHST